MTRQMFSYSCDEVRKLAYDNRQEALGKEDANRFSLHLESCDTCANYVTRTDDMLNAANQIDYGNRLDRDAMFSSIMSTIESKDNNESEFTPTIVAGQDEEQPTSSNAVRYGLFAIAALLIVGISLLILPGDKPAHVENPIIVSDKNTKVFPKTKDKQIQINSTQFADLIQQPSPSHAENLNIFGDSKAEWKVSGKRAQHFELNSGTVLIEYVPQEPSSTLTFAAEDFSIEVLGTIFYASKESQIVGVIAGKIQLKTKDGQQIVLERGQEYVPGIGLRNTDPMVFSQSEKIVDVHGHNALLSKLASKLKDAQRATPNVKKAPKKTKVATLNKRDLRREANLAIVAGNHKIAAQILERMIKELPSSAPENATLQLDLARIYIKNLNRPRRALRHLEGFTKKHPQDAATPSAKKEICRISKQLSLEQDLCED